MRRKTFFLFAVLFITTTLTSCYNENDDNELIIEPPLWNTQLVVSEKKTKTDGSLSTAYSEVYNYTHFIRLNSCSTKNASGVHTSTNNYIIGEEYGSNTRTYTDDQGDEWEYNTSELNGLAKQATYRSGGQVRTYQFDYDSNQQLKSVIEYIDGNQFSSIKFNYNGNTGTTMTITMHGYTDVANIRYTDDVKWNTFPNYFLMEIHPLSIHRVAFYDGLLGINHRVIASMQYEGSDEVTTFEYNLDLSSTDIMPQYCTQTITGDGYSFTRSVNYSFDNLYTK